MATLVVTTLDDEAFDGPESVDTPDGAGLSLREALSLAGSNDTVTFDVALAGSVLSLTNDQFVVSAKDNFTIDGDLDNDGTPDITIDANGNSRHFSFDHGSTNLTIDGLTLTGGTSTHDAGSMHIGSNDVTIRNSIFIDNVATNGGDGGAIVAGARSSLRIYNTKFIDNASIASGFDGFGGAIANFGDLEIHQSTFQNNSSVDSGGAIFSYPGQLTVTETTFVGNTSSFAGGAVASYGDMTVQNSTFVGNTAGFGGGGIYALSDLIVHSSTFTGNFGAGGGHAIHGTSGPYVLTITNSILAGNGTGSNSDELRSTPDFNILGTNIIGSNVYANGEIVGEATLSQIFNQLGVNDYSGIYSGQLADNGGPVQTVMINPNGVALNGGDAAFLPTDIMDLDGDLVLSEAMPLDARGRERVSGVLDLGAVELHLAGGSTTGADHLVADVLDDTLHGRRGDDTIYGDAGDDSLIGGLGADTLRGEAGHDTLLGGSGEDFLVGREGNDQLNGGKGKDLLFGGDGNDTLNGGRQDDFRVSGQGGDDLLHGGTGTDNLFGGDDNDTLYAGGAADRGEGGAGHDLIFGGLGRDSVVGGDGDDTVDGGNGKDTVVGGEGDDSLIGGKAEDSLSGDDGNDTLEGGNRDDTLFGNDGDDVLDGGNQNDQLHGGDGNDILTGGIGDDKFHFALGDDADQITDFTAGTGSEDVIEISGFGPAFDSFAEVLAATADDGFGNAVIDFGGGDTMTLTGVDVGSLHADDFVFG